MVCSGSSGKSKAGIVNFSFQESNPGVAVLHIRPLETDDDFSSQKNIGDIEAGSVLLPADLPESPGPESDLPPKGCFQKMWHSPQMGIAMAVASSFSFSVCSIVVKVMKTMNPIALATYRFLGLFVLSLPLMLYYKQKPFPRGYRTMLVVRSILGCSSLMSQFYAIKHMPLGDATVITFSVPVFVAIFARIFLKEKFTVMNAVTIIFTLAGCVLIARPPWILGRTELTANSTMLELKSCEAKSHFMDVFGEEAVCFSQRPENCTEEGDFPSEEAQEAKYPNLFWGAIIAFSGTIFAANVYIVVRKLKGLHHSSIMTCFGFFALIQTLTITAIIDIKHLYFDPSQWYWIVLLAVFSFFGQILLTMALQREHAGPVSVARSMTIIWAFLWQVTVFHETPVALSLIGAGLVFVSILILAFRKWVESTKPDSTARKRFKVLLM